MSSNQIVMSFHSDAVKDDTLLVAAAEGVEALAQPFRFDLDLVSADPGLDLSAILRVNARISLNRTMDLGDGRSGDIAYDYHGIVTEFRQLGRAGNSRYRYRAVLRPHLWKLACTRRSRIYTDKSVPDLLRAVLDEAGIAFTFKFADEKSYPINPYVVQYEETDLDFISRWMEHVGISYFYDAKGDLGTLVVIDNARSYVPINPYDERVVFDDQAAAGVWSSGRHQRIRNLEVEETRLPKRVQLKEYNYEAPTNELKFEIEVDAKGFGTWYEYNSNYRTESEAKFLLGVRKGFWLGRRRRLIGQADHRSFQSGRTFTLTEHFNPNINDSSYALIEVRHHLSQAAGDDVGSTGEYTCDFIAIPAELPFRPERVTEWPSIHGVVHARIAGGALEYAEIDNMGRYKVDVDYDINDQTIGRVRMSLPSVGEDAGMNFPLRNNTEVLLGHIDGDPDKPIILGAVHDASKPNVVNRLNDPLGTISRVKSQGGNVMEMQDDGPHKSLVMANGNLNTIQMFGRGSYKHPIDGSASQNPDMPAKGKRLSENSQSGTGNVKEAKNKLSDVIGVEPSSSQFTAENTPAETTSFAILPSLYVDPGQEIELRVFNPKKNRIYVWFIKKKTADEDTGVYEEAQNNAVEDASTLNSLGITKDNLDHSEIEMTQEEKDKLVVYAVLSCRPDGECGPDGFFSFFKYTIPTGTGFKNWSWDISCISYKKNGTTMLWERDTSEWQFSDTVYCNQDSDHPLVQAFFKRLELMSKFTDKMQTPADGDGKINYLYPRDSATGLPLKKEAISREFKDLYRKFTYNVKGKSPETSSYSVEDTVPSDNHGLEGMLKVSPPIWNDDTGDKRLIGLALPVLDSVPENSDVDGDFANYEVTFGGNQTVTIGGDISLTYGDSWSKNFGDKYEWNRGHAFDVNLGGNSYSYHLADHDEVSWSKGTVKEYSYGDDKKSYSYLKSEASYSKVSGTSTEKTETHETHSHEIVHELSKSTSNLGRKEEYESVRASVSLAVGGPQFEMSLNGPKLSIEGAGLSVGLEIGLGVVELSLAKKLEISANSTTKLDLIEENDLKPKHTALVGMKTELTTLITEFNQLRSRNLLFDCSKKQAEITEKKIAISKTTTELNKSTLGLYSGMAIFA